MTAPPFLFSLAARDGVAGYIVDNAAHEVVPAILDGRPVLMAFELDSTEHARRHDGGSIGPVPSRGLLHALWTLPEGLAWPISGLDRLDADTLKQEGDGFVAMNGASVTRLYRPAGRVHAIGLAGRRLVDAVAAASQLPPIFRRYAIAAKGTGTDRDAVAAARAIGVGAAVSSPGALRVFARAEPPLVGVPGIYRWWLAEVAYRSLLQANAH